jgi:hypothetical protein
MDDFSKHPKSITELRAQRTQRASDWTPRDALIELLRDIDSGAVTVDALVIIGRQIEGDGVHLLRRICAPDAITSVGLLNRASFQIQYDLAVGWDEA